MMKKLFAFVICLFLTLAVMPGTEAEAKAKPKLSAKSKTMYVGDVYKIKLRNTYITATMTEADKAEKAAWYVSAISDYELCNSNWYDIFIKGSGDCMASCYAVQYLCEYIGIKAQACGSIDAHGMTVAQCDGKFYLIVTGYAGEKPRTYTMYEIDETTVRKYCEDIEKLIVGLLDDWKKKGGSGLMEKLDLDFYYGREAEQFTFCRLPKVLITDSRFDGMSNNSKLLYGLMLDRLSLSKKRGWLDEANRVYIKYSINNIEEDLNVSHKTASTVLKELEAIGLIDIKQQNGVANVIYVKNFVSERQVNAEAGDISDQQRFHASREERCLCGNAIL